MDSPTVTNLPGLDLGLRVSGSPEEWGITALNANTEVFKALHEMTKSLRIVEQGALYRKDGVGFLFGPVGKPVAYLSTRFADSKHCSIV